MNLRTSEFPIITPNERTLVMVNHDGNSRNAYLNDIRDTPLRREVEAARKGESTLVDKIDSIDLSILQIISG
jgi:hypothetical protein